VTSAKLGLIDYINLAIRQNYMVNILITSSAEAKLPSLGFDYGAGKSTEMLNLLKLIWGTWERVKRNLVGIPYEIKPILERPFKSLAWGWDDMQLTVGKDKQNDPDVKELAYYLTTVRPYYSVMLGTAPHRGMLQKDFREMFHFEVIIPVRGIYEVQQLKHWIDFKNPQRIKDRLRYKGQMIFSKLPPDMQKWYNKWRHSKNLEIRKTISLFDKATGSALKLENISEKQKILVKRLFKRGFMSYDLSLRRGFVTEMYALRNAGWVEQDRRRRWILTLDGATLVAQTHT